MKHSYVNLREFFLTSSDVQRFVRKHVEDFYPHIDVSFTAVRDLSAWHQRALLRSAVECYIVQTYGSLHGVRFERDLYKGKAKFYISEMLSGRWTYWREMQRDFILAYVVTG
jgi:type II secretory pathway component PulL